MTKEDQVCHCMKFHTGKCSESGLYNTVLSKEDKPKWEESIRNSKFEECGIYLVDGAEYNVDEDKLVSFISKLEKEAREELIYDFQMKLVELDKEEDPRKDTFSAYSEALLEMSRYLTELSNIEEK